MIFENTQCPVSMEDIWEAYFDCPKKCLGADEFSIELESNLALLYEELVSQTWKPGRSIAFCVDRPKLREVFAAPYKDRVVHHLIIRGLGNIFEGVQVPGSYGSRPGRGTLWAAVNLKAQGFLMTEGWDGKEVWALKCDLQGFFMNIQKDTLWQIVSGILTSPRGSGIKNLPWWLWLVHEVVYHCPESNYEIHGDPGKWKGLNPSKSLILKNDPKTGLPIGNLTSQWFANLYMTVFDVWVTEVLGFKGYVRYVDDFIVMDPDKHKLLRFLSDARTWLKEVLGLTLHPRKVSLQPIQKGVGFVGFVVKPGRIYSGSRTVSALAETIHEAACSERPEEYLPRINSYLGQLIHTQSYGIRWKLLKQLPWDRLGELGWRVGRKGTITKKKKYGRNIDEQKSDSRDGDLQTYELPGNPRIQGDTERYDNLAIPGDAGTTGIPVGGSSITEGYTPGPQGVHRHD